MEKVKKIALVAHDNKKIRLIEWIQQNKNSLKGHTFFATGTTGRLIKEETGLNVEALRSGPLGGDQQIGAKISEGKIDMLIFFWDPLQPMPHDSDVKALLRIAAVWNIPVACNIASADFLVNSTLFQESYENEVDDFSSYRNRSIPK